MKIKKNNLQILNIRNNLVTNLYIKKNNIPFSVDITNNLLLCCLYKNNYIFSYKEYILFLLRKYCGISYHTCFEIYQNILKFHLLEINIKEIFYSIQICNYPSILKQYFYKLYLLCYFLKREIKNKKELKNYYFKSIKDLEIIINIKFLHKIIYHKISENHVRNCIYNFLF